MVINGIIVSNSDNSGHSSNGTIVSVTVTTGWAPRFDSVQLHYKSLSCMVHGRYSELVARVAAGRLGVSLRFCFSCFVVTGLGGFWRGFGGGFWGGVWGGFGVG